MYVFTSDVHLDVVTIITDFVFCTI